MRQSTRKGQGAGPPLGIGRDELPGRSARKQTKRGGEAVAVIARRIAEQRRLEYQKKVSDKLLARRANSTGSLFG